MDEQVRHTHIGGQAVLEGVMMRGRHNWAVACRRAEGGIHVEAHDLHSASRDRAYLRWPVIRGTWGFYETIVLAMKAFGISAALAGETEEERLSSREVGVTMVLGLALAVAVFIILPAVATNALVGSAAQEPLAWNVVDGALRLAVFFGYIWAVSRVRDIQRVFAYHGAEHKTIHAYEHGVPLDPEHVQRYGTMHMRCGTSFLLMVMIVALLVFSLVPVKAVLGAVDVTGRLPALLLSIAMRIVLLPLIAGLAYEVTVKWAGSRPDDPLVRGLMWPGLQLQRMTTREPEDAMIEVAVAAMNAVVEREEAEAAAAVLPEAEPLA